MTQRKLFYKAVITVICTLITLVFSCTVLTSCVASGTDKRVENSKEPLGGTINNGADDETTDNDELRGENEMYIYINGNKLTVDLENNSSVSALIELLKKGDIEYTADDYGNFEKVGNLGHTLPRNDTQTSTVAGDVILYQGNSICIFFGSNSWSYTRLGKINGYSQSELRNLLGAGKGQLTVKLSLK